MCNHVCIMNFNKPVLCVICRRTTVTSSELYDMKTTLGCPHYDLAIKKT